MEAVRLPRLFTFLVFSLGLLLCVHGQFGDSGSDPDQPIVSVESHSLNERRIRHAESNFNVVDPTAAVRSIQDHWEIESSPVVTANEARASKARFEAGGLFLDSARILGASLDAGARILAVDTLLQGLGADSSTTRGMALAAATAAVRAVVKDLEGGAERGGRIDVQRQADFVELFRGIMVAHPEEAQRLAGELGEGRLGYALIARTVEVVSAELFKSEDRS